METRQLAEEFTPHFGRQVEFCTELPPQVNSDGVWANPQSRFWFMKSTVPLLEMQMALIFCMTQFFHFFLKRFGLPKTASQIITGLVLGTSFNKTWAAARDRFFTFNTQRVLGTLSLFGYSLFLFLIGVKMDVGMIRKTGRKAFAIGVLTLVAPLICGMAVDRVIGSLLLNPSNQQKLPFIITTHSLTPFPVIAHLLSELKLLNSELGRLSLSSALVSDLSSITLGSVSILVRVWQVSNPTRAFIDLAAVVGYILVVVFVIRPAMFWVIRHTPAGMPVKDFYVFTIILVVLISAIVANMADQYTLMGPYILGLATPEGPPLGSTLVNKFDTFASHVFLPLYISTCALRVDLAKMSFKDNVIVTNTILVLVTILAKLGACLVPPLYCKMPFKDALAVALIMSCKGVVEMAGYTFLRDSNTITQEIFDLLTLSILFTAIIVPLLVKYLYNPSRKYGGYQKRDIMHLKPNSELRILACIHRPSNIPAVMNLLDSTCPTIEDPIAVYVLHLVELIGRALPVFISHQMHKKSLRGNTSYSEDVIVSFGHFEREYDQGAVFVNTFTAISPHKLMHEDICTLALDKLISLIILPFHRKWSLEGTVESEDHTIRTLNCSVLNVAPCSVGIFVDRGHFGGKTSMVSSAASYCVCVIFLGGKDDREALIYAKRMVKESSVILTVVRLLSPRENNYEVDWEAMLDSEVLNDFKFTILGNGNVKFTEEVVDDGTQTASVLRSIVGHYDLIIVGRRHGIESRQTIGLREWSEFSELGVIGDLLASTDLNSRASVLVLQQQQMT